MDFTKIKAEIRARHKLADDVDVHVLASATVKAVEADPYKFRALITTDSLDRQDEVVIPQGGNIKEFMRGGIISWNHDYSCPVGFPNRSSEVVRNEDGIECGMIFMKRPMDHVGEFFPDVARAFVTQAKAAGISPGVSIGFIPTESRRPTKQDYEKWGDNIQYVHSKWKLLEVAIAPVQANQDAVVTAIGKGLIEAAVAKSLGYKSADVPVPVRRVIHESVLIIADRSANTFTPAMLRDAVEMALAKRFGRMYV